MKELLFFVPMSIQGSKYYTRIVFNKIILTRQICSNHWWTKNKTNKKCCITVQCRVTWQLFEVIMISNCSKVADDEAQPCSQKLSSSHPQDPIMAKRCLPLHAVPWAPSPLTHALNLFSVLARYLTLIALHTVKTSGVFHLHKKEWLEWNGPNGAAKFLSRQFG